MSTSYARFRNDAGCAFDFIAMLVLRLH
jgi:hypothetical protein